MGFPVRTKGTGNTEHMFSQWGLVGTGNREKGTSQSSEARRPAGPPEAKMTPQKKIGGGGILKGPGNREREKGTCRVPQVFPEHVPEPLRENPSLVNVVLYYTKDLKKCNISTALYLGQVEWFKRTDPLSLSNLSHENLKTHFSLFHLYH